MANKADAKNTNEVEVIYKLLKDKMTTKRKLALKLGVSPQAMQSRLILDDNGDSHRMSVAALVQVLVALDCSLVIVPSYRARQIVLEKGCYMIEPKGDWANDLRVL